MFSDILELTEIILQMESGNVTCNERINAINLAEEVKEHSWNKTLSELEEKVKNGTATFNKRIEAMAFPSTLLLHMF